MDPVTAIGLVSGILSFVDTAGKILKLSWTLYNSVEGSSEETQMRLGLADDMAVLSQRIISVNRAASEEDDQALIALAQTCNNLAGDMKKELQSLKPKRRRSKTHSSLAALKTLWGKQKMEDLEKQLQFCRDQLHFHISALAREDIKALLAASKEDGPKLAHLEVSIQQLGQALQDMHITSVESISHEALEQLRTLLRVGQDTLNEAAQDRVLSGIKANFEDMSYRYESVESPFRETFEWIIDLDGKSPEATKFTQWLSSGNGIFHICGKLGSGKSTLSSSNPLLLPSYRRLIEPVKKLCRDGRTRIELEKWMQARGGRKLIIASFFFYALGSDPRQKSLMGLYRTLLYQILTIRPALMPDLLPDQWSEALYRPSIRSAYRVDDHDIRQAYERLSKQNDLGGCCFGIFIDGLDEYQATTSTDRREMVRALTDLASSASGSFKICVSSRMENPFMDMFSETCRFYLHELTKADMEKYVQGNLQHVGTQEQRGILASSITKKAEGVFLWVVLVVQKIRRRFDDGARFSRLLREIESLPTELDELFQRILDTLGTEDRQTMSHTVSLLQLLGTIPEAKKKNLWLELLDFYFLEDYESDPRFAESTVFLEAGSETVEERRIRARRQLRGVCRGLIEADRAHSMDFVHRSVGDFFQQDKVRVTMHDASFHNMDALSQIKLASLRVHHWDMERRNFGKDEAEKTAVEKILDQHSILVAFLVEERRKDHLDVPPFSFLVCLDAIPQLSVCKMIQGAMAFGKTAFRVTLAKELDGDPYMGYDVCHTAQVRHTVAYPSPEDSYGRDDAEDPAILRRDADECIDVISEYSRPIISPLLVELCSGRIEYQIWRMSNLDAMPLEWEKLVMFVYCAIGIGIGRASDFEASREEQRAFRAVGLSFLQLLFHQKVVSPNTLTHLAYGGEFGSIRVAAKDRQLSIWQSFLCWWAAVAAASGDFDAEEYVGSDDESLNDPCEQAETGFLLRIFIKYGADLRLMLSIGDRQEVPTGEDDIWIAYTMKMISEGKETLELDVVVNIHSRMRTLRYPYGSPGKKYWRDSDNKRQPLPLPEMPLSVGDWIARSRLPNKGSLLRLIEKKLRVEV